MKNSFSYSRKLFIIFNYLFLAAIAITCLMPMVNVLAISFSSASNVSAGIVKLWPAGFTLASYKFSLERPEFLMSLLVTAKRIIIGLPLSVFLTILTAYPLSREVNVFKWRTVYAWFLVFTTLFSGGLIPFYMTIKTLGLINNLWVLILPMTLSVGNVVLLLNFFRGVPKEIEDSVFIDGAGYWTSLWRIYVPLSMPCIATIILFTFVGHWNSWFDGLIFMTRIKNYPLQSYLQTLLFKPDIKMMSTSDLMRMSEINDRTNKSAQIFIAMLPILVIYPLLQKYFMKGIVIGSLKG